MITARIGAASNPQVYRWLRAACLAELEGVTTATIQARCRAGAYAGAQKRGKYWYIPATALAVEPETEPSNIELPTSRRSHALARRMSYQEARRFLTRS